ncbi:hypothetical protein Tco_0769093 [Tanacetum coccineum]|uniref:Integrase, catalytic region, zinc finger, CCHC-type, peptidase aspartic, catalytic n=1 Tax=Tanacetum coccineum TaxID=301880 RepID=A0ABQ4ZBU0_9ASTR
MSQEKEAQKKFYKTREDKDIEKVIASENKVKVLDDIIYKTGQSVQTMNMLIRNCKTSFVKPEFLKKAQRENPCLYDIGCYNDTLALMLAPESDETIRLAQEILSKLRVISTTSVSRPQLKSNKLEDRVMHNNSQGKKQQVEDHCRNFKFSNNKTFVTACNDSLNAKTSIVNFVCVTCGKCMLNDNHDMCVLHYINGVNSRTKQPIVMPISTREPKRNVNQSVATPLKKIVAIESTNQKSRSTTRKQYEHVSKTCRWWYSKITPPGYKWKPMTSTVNVKPNVNMPLGNKSRTTNILESKTLRGSTLSNTPLSFNSFAARRDNFVHRRLWVLKTHDGKSQASRVNYAEGLNHSLFFVGQFCDADLKVAFRKSTCYIRDLKGNDLLTDHVSSDPVPKCPTTAHEQDSLSPSPQSQQNVPQVAETITTSNELDLLFSLMFDELFNGSTPFVSKSFVVPAVDTPDKRQQQNTTPSTSTTIGTYTTPLNI